MEFRRLRTAGLDVDQGTLTLMARFLPRLQEAFRQRRRVVGSLKRPVGMALEGLLSCPKASREN